MAEVFLTQPLQIVAGSVAGSKWMSDDLYSRAASKDKKFHGAEVEIIVVCRGPVNDVVRLLPTTTVLR